MSKIQHTKEARQTPPAALAGLHALGARLVLCTRSKAATEKRWQDKRPDVELAAGVLAGGGLVGFVPGSVGLVTVDLDRGGQTGIDAPTGRELQLD